MSIRATALRTRRHWLGSLALCVQVAALFASSTLSASEIHWRTSNFTYVAQDKSLKEFIHDFAADQGVSVVIAPDVDGTINGKFNLTPQSMLDLLAMSYGVMWYYDGSVLYVSSASDVSSEVIPLGAIGAGQFQEALNRLGIYDSRYPIHYDRAHATARMAGPKRYIELVKETLEALNDGGGAGSNSSYTADARTEIRVFPLHYAWAADFTYTADGADHTLPGVVSVLRNLYPSTRTSQHGSSAPQTGKLDRLRGMGYFRDDQVAGTQAERLTQVAPRQDSAAADTEAGIAFGRTNGPTLPQFQADGRMNAVIVRDIPERMGFYGGVIRSLDVKPALVEIEARILEVSSDSIGSLGIDWRARSGSASLNLSPGAPAPMGSSTTSGTTTTNTPTGVVGIPNISAPGLTTPLILSAAQLPQGGILTTVLGDSGRYVMARINALADDGKANILSSPRVLTLDNVEAVLENLNTFFVSVAGNLDVGLFNVSAGTSLRVTPLIVSEGGRTQIKLAVRIEDGGITQQMVGTIPVVQRTTITTQAFINEGESLLIGGYKSDVRNDTVVGVPGLSSIPVLGALFRFRQKETSHVEHLFMLTPHVIER
jgi:type III secretion protein C